MTKLQHADLELINLVVAYEAAPNEEVAEKIVGILRAKNVDLMQVAVWLNKQCNLSNYESSFLLDMNGRFPICYLALGGGPDYLYPFWLNLDARFGSLNKDPFLFNETMFLPFRNRSQQVIFIRDALDLAESETTALRVISESARILAAGGAFISSSCKYDTRWLLMACEKYGLMSLSTEPKRIVERYRFVPRLSEDPPGRSFLLATI